MPIGDPDNHYAETFAQTLATIDKLNREDPSAVSAAIWHWLWENESQQPFIAKAEEDARIDARFWSETANTTELECYMLAACMKLEQGKSMFHRRHIKRLIASLWRRMFPEDQAAFMDWAAKNKNDKE